MSFWSTATVCSGSPPVGSTSCVSQRLPEDMFTGASSNGNTCGKSEGNTVGSSSSLSDGSLAKAEVLIVLYGTSVKQCEGANLIWSSLLHECFGVQHEAGHQTGGPGKAKVGFDARYEIYHCHLPS